MTKTKEKIKSYAKIFTQKALVVPIIYSLFVNLIPNFYDFSSYILTSKASWNALTLSGNYLCWSFVYVVVMYTLFNIV